MIELYKITAPDGLLYIGASNDARRRWIDHNAKAKAGSNCDIHKAIRKFGWKNFKKQILVIGPDEYIYELEMKAIEAFNTITPFGYNMLPGGKISPMTDKNIARRVRIAKTGKKNPRRSKAFQAKGNPMFGKSHSIQSLEKMKIAISMRPKIECVMCKKMFSKHTYGRHSQKCESVQ